MNLTKAAQVSTKFNIKLDNEESVEFWGLPYKATDAFLDTFREGDNAPISKVLPHIVTDWNLTHDVEKFDENVDIEKEDAKSYFLNEKIPITEEAISREVPLWLQGLIWQAILGYKVPNPTR
jgi:hypothetical protein